MIGVTGSTAAYNAVVSQAIKASGAIVSLNPDEFSTIITKSKKPLVVYSKGGFMNKYHDYLTSYGGFIFYSRAKEPLNLPGDSEVIRAGNIWIPG